MLEENEQLPDWLIELRDQQIAEQTETQDSESMAPPQPEAFTPEQTPPAEDAFEDDRPSPPTYAEEEGVVEDLSEPQPPPEPQDALDSLREQMIIAEEELGDEEQVSGPLAFVHSIMQLKPSQRLALAVMLFFEVAIGGCVLLMMTERVVIPF